MSVVDGDVLRITCNFELGDGTQYQNIYHYIRDGTDPFTDAQHVTAIESRMGTIYATIAALTLNSVVEQLSFVDRVAWDAPTTSWKVVENIGTFTPAFTPSEAGDGLPYQSSPYVVFKTERPKSVGKKYLFPFSEAQQDETILIAGAVTALVAYGAAALASPSLGGDATLSPVIVRTGVETVLRFLVAVVNDVIGSQKRRRPGVGA